LIQQSTVSRGIGVLIAVLCLTIGVAAIQSQLLTNADVIKMTRAGLGENVILASIEGAVEKRFDTSADALVALKQAGVSDAVLAALLSSSARKTTVSSGADRRSASPGATPGGRLAPGIYVDAGSQEGSQLIQLEPTVVSKIRTSGGLATALSFGISKITAIAEVRGSRANQRVTRQQPDFYFYFPDDETGVGGPFVGWLAGASSPNEFVLLQMYREKDRREMDVAKANAYGNSSGVESENTVPMKIEKLAPGVYRVTPTEPLGRGEFCFFYAAGAGAMQNGVVAKLFDFGID